MTFNSSSENGRSGVNAVAFSLTTSSSFSPLRIPSESGNPDRVKRQAIRKINDHTFRFNNFVLNQA